MTDLELLESVFPVSGMKAVSPTDKGKAAYVVHHDQIAVLEAAGVTPSTERPAEPFCIKVLFDDIDEVEASFYHAIRETDPGRPPEPRMGHAFISQWLEEGDELFLGTDGESVFACKVTREEASEEKQQEREADVYARLSSGRLRTIASGHPRRPKRREVTVKQYDRSPVVAALALRRAAGRCESPGCDYSPFLKSNGDPYLEVHHVVPLSEEGEDVSTNVAAICPNCHRAQHHAKDRSDLRATLRRAIVERSERFDKGLG